ncbi:hypothetical protein Taro_031469, partial [Colocasia esculenta]|nr:hypothetical protein [Colocasia esculenta]
SLLFLLLSVFPFPFAVRPLPDLVCAKQGREEGRGTRPPSSFSLPDGDAAREVRHQGFKETAAATRPSSTRRQGFKQQRRGRAARGRRWLEQRRRGRAAAARAVAARSSRGDRRHQRRGLVAAATVGTPASGRGGCWALLPPFASSPSSCCGGTSREGQARQKSGATNAPHETGVRE